MLYWLCCPSPFWQQKGVDTMDTILTNFLVAVAAQVAAHFLCKWLERHRKGKKAQKEPSRSCNSERALFCAWIQWNVLTNFLPLVYAIPHKSQDAMKKVHSSSSAFRPVD